MLMLYEIKFSLLQSDSNKGLFSHTKILHFILFLDQTVTKLTQFYITRQIFSKGQKL